MNEIAPDRLEVHVQVRRGDALFLSTGEHPIELSVGEIVSLEGGNQSGKSTIVGCLVGAYPRQKQKRKRQRPRFMALRRADQMIAEPSMRLSSRAFDPVTVSDAASRGVIAVFQEDRMVRTMTIFDQYALRYAPSGDLGVALRAFAHEHWARIRKALIGAFPPEGRVAALLRRLPLQKSALERASELRDRALALLKQFDLPGREPFSGNLDKLPEELSGGGRAVAKIVGALLDERLRFLILDEVFSGVDQAIWEELLDQISAQAREKRIGVLFISHVWAEHVRWQPVRRYVIANGQILLTRSAPGALFTLQGQVRANHQIAVFEANPAAGRAIDWAVIASRQVAVVADRALVHLPAFLEMRRHLEANGTATFFDLDIVEAAKSLATVETILKFLMGALPSTSGTIICVGGGALLNVAGLAASLFLRGRVPTIYVPTTLIAMSDVAIGSKVGINHAGNGLHAKHAVGNFFDPTAVILDPRYLDTVPDNHLLPDLAEIAKHGIVQDAHLFHDVLKASVAPAGARPKLYALARQTLLRKQEVLLADFSEQGVGRILQFGHLHAHSLERASGFVIPHGIAVWIGMYLELILGGNRIDIEGQFLTDFVLGFVNRIGPVPIPPTDRLHAAYRAETKSEFRGEGDQYAILEVPELGCHADLENSRLTTKFVHWNDIAKAWDTLRVSRPSRRKAGPK